MDTKAFTAALVALALLTGCAPTNPTAPGTPGAPSAPGQQTPAQGQGGQGQGQGQNRAGGGQGQGGQWQGGAGGPGQGGTGRGGRQAVTVQIEVVKSGTLWVDNSTAGAVVAEVQSTVAAGASGTVKTILRQAGDWVETGTPVVQLDDTQLRLSLRLAQATLDNAKINAGVGDASKLGLQVQSAQSALASSQKNFASAQALAKVGGISGSDLDNAQTQLQNAQANLESAKMTQQQSLLQVETASIQLQQAQLNLSNATIKAPYAGQISAVSLHPGEFVGTSTAAFSLVSRNKVINFGVSPIDAPGLSLGSPVRFTFGGKAVDTKVTQAPSAPVNGLVPLTAALPVSLNAPLGTVGTLSYRLPAAEGVLVPLPALQSAENKTFVYTAENGKAQRHEVTVLGDSGTYTAVTGLIAGATVIVNPPPGLLIGGAIQFADAAAAGAGATAGAGSGTGTKKFQGQGAGNAGAPQGQGQGGWNGQKRQGAGTGAAAAGEGPAQAPGQGQGTWNGQRRQGAAASGGEGAAGTATEAGAGAASGQGQRRRQGSDAASAAQAPATTGGQ